MKLLEHLQRRGIKYILIAYILLTIAYTSTRFYNITGSPHHRTTRRSVIEPITELKSKNDFFVAPLAQEIIESDEYEELIKAAYIDSQQHLPFGQNDKNTAQLYKYKEDTATLKSVMQEKAFASAMGPSDLQPFYFKASENFEREDITMSTIVTSDRFPVLSRLATRYKGPISAAIHINDDENMKKELNLLVKTFEENPDMKRYVDVHLIVDKYDRQFNMWRNTAKLYARTDYIMMLDIDFYLCTDFRTNILQNPFLMNKLREGRSALVVPAFEYLSQTDGIDYTVFPNTKDKLLQEVFDEEKLDMFHASWQNGHAATNYAKWYTASEPYKVEEYNFSYEPYVIFKKQGSPWCDERFIGYGANKAACLYEIYLSGMDYYVLPDDFLIHQSHFYPESTRKRERAFNRKVYANFREELCLRYSRQFVADGDWNTARSENLRKECQKIRGLKNVLETIDQ